MLPRTKAEADPKAEATMESLRRHHEHQQQPKRGTNWGPIILALAIGWVGGILFLSRSKTADPLADARLNNAPSSTPATPTPPKPVPPLPTPRAELVRLNPGVPRAQLVRLPAPDSERKVVQYGESFWAHMPDGRWIIATAMGRANQLEELPWTGNRIGDARWIGEHCFIWLPQIGQSTNPQWIDP